MSQKTDPPEYGAAVQCRCGHTADMGHFVHRPISGELPPGHFQCPACNYAWRVDHHASEAKLVPAGEFNGRFYRAHLDIPATTLEPISPRL